MPVHEKRFTAEKWYLNEEENYIMCYIEKMMLRTLSSIILSKDEFKINDGTPHDISVIKSLELSL